MCKPAGEIRMSKVIPLPRKERDDEQQDDKEAA